MGLSAGASAMTIVVLIQEVLASAHDMVYSSRLSSGPLAPVLSLLQNGRARPHSRRVGRRGERDGFASGASGRSTKRKRFAG